MKRKDKGKWYPLEGQATARKRSHRRRRRGRKFRQGRLNRLCAEFDGIAVCAYCACLMAPEDATLDHITPLSKGGTDDVENLALACYKCNHHKKSSLQEPRYRTMADLPPYVREAIPEFREDMSRPWKVSSPGTGPSVRQPCGKSKHKRVESEPQKSSPLTTMEDAWP